MQKRLFRKRNGRFSFFLFDVARQHEKPGNVKVLDLPTVSEMITRNTVKVTAANPVRDHKDVSTFSEEDEKTLIPGLSWCLR